MRLGLINELSPELLILVILYSTKEGEVSISLIFGTSLTSSFSPNFICPTSCVISNESNSTPDCVPALTTFNFHFILAVEDQT